MEKTLERTYDPIAEPILAEQVFRQHMWSCTGIVVLHRNYAPEGLHSVERAQTAAVLEELQPMGRIHIGKVCGGLFPVGGPYTGAGEENEEERAAETM